MFVVRQWPAPLMLLAGEDQPRRAAAAWGDDDRVNVIISCDVIDDNITTNDHIHSLIINPGRGGPPRRCG